MRLRARHYRTGESLDLVCADGLIQSVEPAGTGAADVEASWVAPAFFDIQINGCGGIGFGSPDLTPTKVRAVVETCRSHGISQLLPTIITGPFEALAHGFRTIRQARETDADLAHALGGMHLEGPYIAAEDGPRGAHPRAHVRPPDLDEFARLQDAAGGLIRLVTLAPELPGALPFIERLTAAGIVVALGHTAATPDVIRAGVDAGARLSTHLGNGSHALLPRHDNYIWEQLAEDRLWASIIADGHHLPARVLRCLVRVKSPARLILTCDAGPLAGLPPGRYRDWDQEFEVRPEGKVVVPGTGFLAGSWAFTDACVATLMRLGEIAPAEVIDLAGAQPRELLGVPPRVLVAGAPADLVLYDMGPADAFRLRATLTAGRLYTAAAAG